jgi:hypothetical protein
VTRADAYLSSDPSDHELTAADAAGGTCLRWTAPRGAEGTNIPGPVKVSGRQGPRFADGDASITAVLHVRPGASGKGWCLSFLWETKMEGSVWQ